MIPRYFKQFLAIALILIGGVVAQQSLHAQCIPPPGGMTAWWPLDEAAGPTANDIATGGVNNSGTWIGAPVPVAGKVGGALSFSGTNSVDVPDHSELNFGTGDFSIDMWIKTTNSSGTRTIIDKRTSSPNIKGYVLFLSNGNLGSQIGDGAGYNNCVTTGFVADGNWHHIALTVDRNNASGWRHYVDGSATATIGNPTGWQGSLTNTAPFVMARNLVSPSQTFAGTLDEVELFNRVLDTAEIRSIWAAGSFGKCKDTCHSTGDANNDGIPLQVADMAYLAGFINFCGSAPAVLYSCDLNGDGYVNSADLQLYQSYFVSGVGVFAPYGGYPVHCPCDPIPAPVPDTVSIFGLEHVSAGPTCLNVGSGALTVTRFMTDMAPDGITIDVPDAISSPSSIIWRGELQNPDLGGGLPVGATIQARFANYRIGFPPPEPIDPLAMIISMTKAAANTWNLAVESDATIYTIEAFNNGSSVFTGTYAGGTAGLGNIVETAKGVYPTGFKGSTTGKPASVVASSDYNFTAGSGVLWTWAGHGVSSLPIDYLSISAEVDTACRGLTCVGIYAQQIDSFTITSEALSFSYGDVMITPLGDAIVTPDDTTLVVSNIGSSGNAGIDAEHDSKDGEWSITWKNPDQSGTFPTGASVGTEFFFSTPTDPDTLSMGLSMTKAAANNWNLAVLSGAAACSVKAFNNGTQVFATSASGTAGLGNIVETAKGVYPTGFKGSTTGKPASVVASSDYNFTAGSGVLWTWAGHGVSSLPIDYLSISTEVPGTRLFGVTHTEMCGNNGGARSDPISFTILDITVTPGYVCGDANGDDAVDISDAVYLIAYIFSGGSAPSPLLAGDANCDAAVDISDVVYLIAYIFSGGKAPCAP